MTKDDIRDLLTYRSPTPSKKVLHEGVNKTILDAALRLADILGDSPLLRDVIMRLSDARMLANMAVSQMTDFQAERASATAMLDAVDHEARRKFQAAFDQQSATMPLGVDAVANGIDATFADLDRHTKGST